MKLGRFAQEGRQYIINTPITPGKWYNCLFNDAYYMDVSQTLAGNSICLTPSIRTFTRGYRYFYIQDRNTGECWNPNFRPLKTVLDSYECIFELGYAELKSSYKGIDTSIRVFVPVEGMYEIWTIKITNNSKETKDLSLYSVFSFEDSSVMGSKCTFDHESQILSSFTFPYHVKYEEKEKCDNNNSLGFMFSDLPVHSYDCGESWFYGCDDINELPAAVKNGVCSNNIAEADKPIGVFQQKTCLKSGEELKLNIVFGCTNTIEDVKEIKKTLNNNTAIEAEFKKVVDYWDEISNLFTINTPDKNLDYMINYWLKKQMALMSRTNRLSFYCPVRNQLQDAMGFSMLDVEAAGNIMLKVMARQENEGFLHQWYMADDSPPRGLCFLNHMDGPIWLVLCMCELINQAGDPSILEKEVVFKDTRLKASVYEHLLKAVYYLFNQRGEHGLVLMGDGDWTDPVNGAGRLGKGESTWSTLGLKYAVMQLLPLCKRKKDIANSEKLQNMVDELDEAVNSMCWDGDWYVAGFDDNGIAFASHTDEEAKLFLNAQTWAIMSNTARGERLRKLVKAVDSLDSECGPRLLAPEFKNWNPRWGRISIKLAGTTENGSVYCHASMFKAYSDFILGNADKAYVTISKTLPTNPENPPEKSWQVPIFVPNYYFGLKESPNFGHSSQNIFTGTTAWLVWLTTDHMLGARSTVDGLVIQPCIPAEWKEFNLERRYRNSRYRISVKNPECLSVGVKKIFVNGSMIEGIVLPYESGKEYDVEVIMGR